MNEDKPDARPLYCLFCGQALEFVDGAPKALCHECGTQFLLQLNTGDYLTYDRQLQQLHITYRHR